MFVCFMLFIFVYLFKSCDKVLITIEQVHSKESDLRFCTDANGNFTKTFNNGPARSKGLVRFYQLTVSHKRID